MKPILLIFTGGTICSFGDEDNLNRDVDIKKAKMLITKNFKESESAFADTEFETAYVLDTLSENMTTEKWNTLANYLKGVDFDSYQGVIMTHGTDTIAYTSCFMALLMSGVNIPMCIVSSRLPLNDKNTNGNRNFSMAVSLIRQGVPAGVYVPYENVNGKMYIHKGEHLMQCENYLDDFHSYDEAAISEEEIPEYIKSISGRKDKKNQTFKIDLKKMPEISSCVLYIKPYVGLNYAMYNIDSKIKAVVHGTYHSCTACVERKNKEQDYTSASILYLIEKCSLLGIPVIAEPCREDASLYVSCSDMLQAGVISVYGMTSEMVYVKTLVGCAMNMERKELTEFLRNDICGK